MNKIPDEYENLYKKGLNSIEFISVRENDGANIVENLINKKVKVVLDPTLMVSKNEWIQLIVDKPKYKEKYILTYFLDKPTEEDRSYIKDFSKKKSIKNKKFNIFRF